MASRPPTAPAETGDVKTDDDPVPLMPSIQESVIRVTPVHLPCVTVVHRVNRRRQAFKPSSRVISPDPWLATVPDVSFTEASTARFGQGALGGACCTSHPYIEMLAKTYQLPTHAGVCGTRVRCCGGISLPECIPSHYVLPPVWPSHKVSAWCTSKLHIEMLAKIYQLLTHTGVCGTHVRSCGGISCVPSHYLLPPVWPSHKVPAWRVGGRDWLIPVTYQLVL